MFALCDSIIRFCVRFMKVQAARQLFCLRLGRDVPEVICMFVNLDPDKHIVVLQLTAKMNRVVRKGNDQKRSADAGFRRLE